MQDFINIGSTPCNEECASVGSDHYSTYAKIECRAYIAQLQRLYPEPECGYFKIKSFPHDFGTYYEVVAVYDEEDEESTKWAFDAESGAEEWDDQAREYLLAERLRVAETLPAPAWPVAA